MSDKRYVINRSLGKGLTGEVFEAEDTMLKRKVAYRKMQFADEPEHKEEFEEQFFNVTRGLSGLSHPGICTVFDGGINEEGAFIVYQLLNGESMQSRLGRGPIHEWNVYQHGAINPSSIIRVPRASGGYRNIIVDLGLNNLTAPLYGKAAENSSFAEPLMMAPEQFDGAPVSELTDLYMIGHFAYIFLIGGHPYAGMTSEELIAEHKRSPIKSLDDADVVLTKEFTSWLHTLIERDPKNRPQSIVEAQKSMPMMYKPMAVHTAPVNVKATPGGALNGAAALPKIPPAKAPH